MVITTLSFAKPPHFCTGRHCYVCNDYDNEVDMEDLMGFAALLTLAVEAGAEQAIEERGTAPTAEEKELLDTLKLIRKAAVETVNDEDEDISSAEAKIRRAKRLLREAEEELESSSRKKDTLDDEMSAEILKAILKGAMQDL